MSTSDDFPLSHSGSSDVGFDTAPGVGSGTDAGASGTSSGIVISTGGLIAIIVVVVFVTIIGLSTAVLFFIAKKREWTMKETLRRSARKVKTVLTPRRTEFPDYVKDRAHSSKRGHARLSDGISSKSRTRSNDLEKGPRFEAVGGSNGRQWPRK